MTRAIVGHQAIRQSDGTRADIRTRKATFFKFSPDPRKQVKIRLNS